MKANKYHFIFGVGYFILAYTTDKIFASDTTFIKEIIFYLTQNVYLFYSLLFFLNRFSTKSKKDAFKSFFRLLIIIAGFFSMRYLVRYLLLATFFDPEYALMPLHEWLAGNVIWIVNYFFFASAYYYFTSSIQKQENVNQLTKKNLIQEKERLELENALLKSQNQPAFPL